MKISKWLNSILLPIHYHNKLIEFRCHILSTTICDINERVQLSRILTYQAEPNPLRLKPIAKWIWKIVKHEKKKKFELILEKS